MTTRRPGPRPRGRGGGDRFARASHRLHPALSASPEGDFTVSVRAAWWRGDGLDAEQVAAACGRRGPVGTTSYILRDDRLGVTYSVQGVFLARADGLLRLEVESPMRMQPLLVDLFQAWVKALSR